MTTKTIHLDDLQATEALAASLAKAAEIGDVILLQGDLGTGKTAFCRAFIQSTQQQPEEVPSPTFTLLQTFQGERYPIWHFDLYRLKYTEEALELGLEEAFEVGVSLIEWPELISELLPENCLSIRLSYGIDKEKRIALLQGIGRWEKNLEALEDHARA